MIFYIKICLVEHSGDTKYVVVSAEDIIKGGLNKFTVKKTDSIYEYLKKNTPLLDLGKVDINVVASVDYGAYGNNLQVATPLEAEQFSLKYGEYLI